MNPLDDVILWYRFSRDSQKTLLSILKEDPTAIPEDSPLANLSYAEIAVTTRRSLQEIDDLVVLGLASYFEQTILAHVEAQARALSAQTLRPLEARLLDYGLREVERWRFKDILTLYRGTVSDPVIGLAKQIYDYRNWVAHGKKVQQPVHIDPETAYTRLSDFLR